MRILLLYPHQKYKEYSALRPPLGLAYIAAVLEKEGHKVRIIDLSLEENPLSIFTEEFLDTYDLVGISVLTSLYNSSREIIKTIRKKNEVVPIIMGGPHPSAMPELCLKENDIDVVVRQEGELTFKELAEHYDKSKASKELKEILGISYMEAKKVIMHTSNRPLIKDLDKLPPPARHLLKIDQYKNKIHGRYATTLMSSRGCPYKCVYCFKVDGPNWRPRNSKLVVDEMENIVKKYKITAFYFHDDLFTASKQRVIDICNEILKRNLKIIWICESRVNTIDEEMLEKMKKAGCVQIHYGIESGDEMSLEKMGKGVKKEDAKKALQLTHNAKIYSKAYFMIGFPWDTRETLMNSLNFIKEIEADEVLLNVVTPYPGTWLWDEAVKRKTVDPDNIDWDRFYGSTPDISEQVYFTDHLSKQEVINMKKFMYREIIKNKLWKKVKEGDLKYIFNIIREKKDVGLFKFMYKLFLRR